jgi:pimeloyl-ACP methyl ester carboxylesterase
MGLESTFRIISPTLPGFGLSESQNGRALATFGGDMKELMDHMKINELVLCGVSWGGPHSASVALAMPERVKGWLLMAPVVPALPDFPGWTAIMPDPVGRFIHHHLFPCSFLNINRGLIRWFVRPVMKFLAQDHQGFLANLARKFIYAGPLSPLGSYALLPDKVGALDAHIK